MTTQTTKPKRVGFESFEEIAAKETKAVPAMKSTSTLSWQAGVAFALAEVWRLHQEDIVVKDVLKQSGITLNDLRKGGADPYDYNAVREALVSAGEKP